MSRAEDTMMFKTYSEIRVKCKRCGHTNTIPAFLDKKTCWFCKYNITNNTLAHFKYKIRKIIGGDNNDKKNR